MPKFRVIQGSPAPDSPAERVRARIKAARPKGGVFCQRCGGMETITAKIGNVKNKLCVCCLMSGRRSIVE